MIFSAWVRMLNIKYVGRYDEVFGHFGRLCSSRRQHNRTNGGISSNRSSHHRSVVFSACRRGNGPTSSFDSAAKNAIVAILARQKDLPSKAEAMQQRRESTKRKVAQQQQQQLLQQEQQSRPKVLKPPSVQTKVGAKPPSDKIQVISDDEDPESPAGLSDDIDILIPIAKRSSRQIFKLPPDVIIKAARMLRLDNGGATTKLTSLRAKVKDYFSRGSSVLDTYNSEDSFSFTDNSPSSSPLQPAAARSAWMPPPPQARPACMPPPPPPSMPPPPPPEVPSSPWKTFTDPLGKPYFYNTNTSESTWDPPGIFQLRRRRRHRLRRKYFQTNGRNIQMHGDILLAQCHHIRIHLGSPCHIFGTQGTFKLRI